MSDEKIKKPDYSRYATARDAGLLDHGWRQGVKADIQAGDFKSFTSANATAKQWVVVCMDHAGLTAKITSLGCGVHRIEVDHAAK